MQKFDYDSLDGRHLTVFLAVYDTGSFSRAAEQFDINQSTVSYAMEKLRSRFDDVLFVKSGRGVVPTERAIALVPRIRNLLTQLQGLAEPDEYLPQNDDQTLSIGVNSLVLFPSFVELYRSVKKIAPAVTIRIVEFGSRSMVTPLLERNEIDLAISIANVNYSASLSFQRVLSSKLVCYFDDDERETLKTVSDYLEADHAVADFGKPNLSLVRMALEGAALKRTIKLYAPNVQALGELIKGTTLICTMPKILRNTVFANLSICPCPIDLPSAEMDMVWHKRNENSKRNQWIRDLALKSFKAIQTTN